MNDTIATDGGEKSRTILDEGRLWGRSLVPTVDFRRGTEWPPRL